MVRHGVLILAGAVLLSACGSPEAESGQGTTPSPTASPTTESTPSPSSAPQTPEQEWSSALSTTTGQATVEAQLLTNVEGFERIVAGEGTVQPANGYGDITWSDELSTTREIQTVDGHFLELDGTWFLLDGETGVPTKVGFTPLAGLESATNVIRVGDEEVVGVSATRFDANLDPNAGPATMGFSGEELTVVNDATDASLVATIWIDDAGRIVRVLREYSASSPDSDPISATTLYLLSNFTEPTPIEVPETANAIPAPA